MSLMLEQRTFLVLLFICIVSFSVSHVVAWVIVRRALKTPVAGIDMHKQSKPRIPEMGGYSIIAGTLAGLLIAIFLSSFSVVNMSAIPLIAVAMVVAVAGLIGTFDDIFDIPQLFKAIVPLFIGAPLIALSVAGDTSLSFPFIGKIDFGIFYLILLVPLAIAVCSNLTNMLAGFNGLEVGLAMPIFAGLIFLGFLHNNLILILPLLSALSASIAFYLFNKYPAKLFPGDTGTFVLGAVIAASVIVGNFESAGAFMMLMYYVDFFLKLRAGFPKSFCVLGDDGKLHPPDGKIRGFVDLVLKMSKGMSEQQLVNFLVSVQIVIVLLVVLLYGVLWLN